MQVEELTHVKTDVDYNQIPPIQQKRIIAFVNHFVTNTVSYLNNFSQSCESSFLEFEYKIQKVEASLLILEAQLASIPGFDRLVEAPKENSGEANVISSILPTEQTLALPEVPQQKENTPSNNDIVQAAQVENNTPSGPKASEHPVYAKFFKMVRVGVHPQAVRLKMQSEGCDPAILDNPDAIIPDSDVKS